MNKEMRQFRQRVRSARSAAIAGILFAVLLSISTILMYPITRINPGKIDQKWLDSESAEASIAIFLIPLAGIAFIWFKGVIRDRLGNREDRFFATIFLGSGLIIVGMLFVWGATIGVIFGSYAAVAEVPFGADVVVFGFKFMH